MADTKVGSTRFANAGQAPEAPPSKLTKVGVVVGIALTAVGAALTAAYWSVLTAELHSGVLIGAAVISAIGVFALGKTAYRCFIKSYPTDYKHDMNHDREKRKNRRKGIISGACGLVAKDFGIGPTGNRDPGKLRNLTHLTSAKKVEKAEFISGNGKGDNLHALEGMYFEPKNPTGKTVLVCSGSHACFEETGVPIVDAFLNMGCRVFVFNYRGFGSSEGEAEEEAFYEDVEAAYQYLHEDKGCIDEQMVVYGYSMGCAPATHLATKHKVDVVLDRYFSSMPDVAKDQGTIIAKKVFEKGHVTFDIAGKITNVQGRIFLARGTRDTTMKSHHQDALQGVLGDKEGVQFHEVDSIHEIISPEQLWYHENCFNDKNDVARKALKQFVQIS